jgi:hypothetical protein
VRETREQCGSARGRRQRSRLVPPGLGPTEEAPQLTRSQQQQQQQRQQKQRQQKKRAKRASGNQPASEGGGDGEEDLDLGADETADWRTGQRLPPPKPMGATHAGNGRQQRRNGLHGAGNGTDANNEDSPNLQMGDRASEPNGEAAAGGAALPPLSPS